MPAAALVGVIVSVEDDPAGTDVGLSAAEAPEGKPLTDKAIAPGAPRVTAVVTVDWPEPPFGTVTEVGPAVNEKSSVALETMA